MILISIEVLRSKICLKKKKKINDTERTRRTARVLKIIRVMIDLNHFIYKYTIISSTNSEHYMQRERNILPFIQQ